MSYAVCASVKSGKLCTPPTCAEHHKQNARAGCAPVLAGLAQIVRACSPILCRRWNAAHSLYATSTPIAGPIKSKT